jgi:hypothetical protein
MNETVKLCLESLSSGAIALITMLPFGLFIGAVDFANWSLLPRAAVILGALIIMGLVQRWYWRLLGKGNHNRSN